MLQRVHIGQWYLGFHLKLSVGLINGQVVFTPPHKTSTPEWSGTAWKGHDGPSIRHSVLLPAKQSTVAKRDRSYRQKLDGPVVKKTFQRAVG